MITTVVFDLDDTLYDELDYCKSGFDAVAHFLAKQFPNLSAENIFTALWHQFHAGNHTKTFNAAFDALGLKYDTDLIAQCVQTYRNHNPKITLPTETKDILEQLSKKYTLALLTDGFLPAQKLKVQTLGIENYFKAIIYTEEMGRQFWKPSPIGFEKLMRDLNIKPETCAYVADNPVKDFIAPNYLGFATIQLLRQNRIHLDQPPDKKAAPKYVIHKINDLASVLEKT